MCLVEADAAGSIAQLLERLGARRPAQISRHPGDCCLAAREWFLSMDSSLRGDVGALGGPRWIRDRYEWGPLTWPLYWCQAVESVHLDCGGLAALAREALAARGLTTLPVQLLQVFSQAAASHWRRRWGTDAAQWIFGELAYHEVCAVREGDQIKIWDPADNWWICPEQSPGYGAAFALRVLTGNGGTSSLLRWGNHRIRSDAWIVTPWYAPLAVALPGSGEAPGQ